MSTWLVNGRANGTVSPDDRGLAYGDGLFETIAVRDGDFRLLDYHLERLQRGCERLGLPAPDPQQLREELQRAAGGCRAGTGKIIITRGCGPRGYRIPQETVPTRVVGVSGASDDALPDWSSGIHVRLCHTLCSENPALAGIKTLNRLEQVLARAEWTAPDIAEGLMRTADGALIGGTMSNLFAVAAGRLLTPSLASCGVHGVMRRAVMETAAEAGIAVREIRLTWPMLQGAEELFVCNSLRGIGPITRLEDRDYAIGPTTRQLIGTLAERGISECAGA